MQSQQGRAQNRYAWQGAAGWQPFNRSAGGWRQPLWQGASCASPCHRSLSSALTPPPPEQAPGSCSPTPGHVPRGAAAGGHTAAWQGCPRSLLLMQPGPLPRQRHGWPSAHEPDSICLGHEKSMRGWQAEEAGDSCHDSFVSERFLLFPWCSDSSRRMPPHIYPWAITPSPAVTLQAELMDPSGSGTEREV